MCLLLIGLSCRGRKIALLILSLVFYTMLSDGRLNFFMVIFYIGMLCLLDILPSFNTLALQNSSTKFDTRPIRTFLLALSLTFFISMVSILTALELINTKGGLRHIDLFFYPDIYSVSAYEFQRLWKETVGWRRQAGFMTIVIPQKVFLELIRLFSPG